MENKILRWLVSKFHGGSLCSLKFLNNNEYQCLFKGYTFVNIFCHSMSESLGEI